LPHAIKTRDLEMIKKLFALGADPNVLIDSGSTPLQYAVELQVELNIIEELLQKSANPNIDNYGNPLKIAICTNNTNLLELLLRYHADPNKSIDSAFPLTIALRKEDMESINLLLEYKADPTLLSSPPALHLAVQTGNIDIFNKIKAFYSSHTVYDHKGKTPLLIALDYRYVDIANALYLDNKINLETYSNHYEKLNVFASAVKFVMQPKYFSNMEYPKIQRTLDKVISQAYKDFGGYPENKQDISQPLEALINEISHIANSLTTENNGSLFSKNKLLLICQKELFEIIKEYSPSNNSGQQNTINS
ncbi:MAG: ankyrin repeat domain-containing protein, partial [Gammaproteobacteria bacterium]|nr:ankyrin repeat domain-containing protein [Gammaproteobacteria bacterium]